MLFKKKRLAVAITVFWILLAYIVTGLGYWVIALEARSQQISAYQLRELRPGDPGYTVKYNAILDQKKKKTAQYVGEGSTFLLLILLGAIFVFREVRRQIRLQLQQQNFMMAVTHELKTPIAVTKLNLETLQKHRLDEQKQQKIIQVALQETGRLDTLANNILIASQLEGGDYTRSKEELDLSPLVQRIIQDLRHRYPDREWEDAIEPDCTLSGDPLLLQMLVSNLAENAIKYSPKSGLITITLRKEKGHILLQVKDEGPGIPDKEKKKI